MRQKRTKPLPEHVDAAFINIAHGDAEHRGSGKVETGVILTAVPVDRGVRAVAGFYPESVGFWFAIDIVRALHEGKKSPTATVFLDALDRAVMALGLSDTTQDAISRVVLAGVAKAIRDAAPKESKP